MIEKKIRYFANGFVSVLDIGNNALIETTSTCLPIGTEIRITGKEDNSIGINEFNIDNWKEKWMIGISTQSGCPVKCKFCAVNRITDEFGWRNLTAQEMVDQVEYAIRETKKINDSVDPSESEIFRILFTRMGEPSLNIENVIEAIIRIKTKWPKARIQISTIGLAKSVTLVEKLIMLEAVYGYDWLELQFSIHSTSNVFRKWLQTGAVLTNGEIGDLAFRWYYSFYDRPWKATLNFALSKDTPFNADQLLDSFNPETVFIKLSPINENVVSEENGLKTLFNYENSI